MLTRAHLKKWSGLRSKVALRSLPSECLIAVLRSRRIRGNPPSFPRRGRTRKETVELPVSPESTTPITQHTRGSVTIPDFQHTINHMSNRPLPGPQK